MRPLLILCCAAIFNASICGQSLQTDLEKSFRQFNIVDIDAAEARRKVVMGAPLEIRINKRSYRFDLKPSDVRAADYAAEYADENGRHRLPRGEVYTYQGTIEGEPHSLVALTIDGEKVEGYFATASENFFIEAARNYSASAGKDEKVVYRVADKVDSDDNICGLDDNLGADHACPTSIMQAPLYFHATGFCQFSKDQIGSYINTYGERCLEVDPAGRRAPLFDFDGDGRADISVFRPSSGAWFRLDSRDNSFAAVRFGSPGDKPVPADYDGDGRTDIGIFRPSSGTWYLLRSSEGFAAQRFGLSGDEPIPSAYVK